MFFIESPQKNNASNVCRLFKIPYFTTLNKYLDIYNSPALNSVFISFVTIYFYLPMTETNEINYPLLFLLLSFLGIDTTTQLALNCTNYAGVALGVFTGLLLGYAWYTIIYNRNKNLLYLSSNKNNKEYKRYNLKKNKEFKMY